MRRIELDEQEYEVLLVILDLKPLTEYQKGLADMRVEETHYLDMLKRKVAVA